MNHLGTLSLETDRLILRRFTLEDAPAMFRNWAGDPAVTEYLTWPTHPDEHVTAFVIGNWVSRYDDPTCYEWALELKSLGEPIGSIAVVRAQENGPVSTAEIGYCMGRPWWGQGLMPEALRAVIAFLFDRVGYTRIEARHAADNPKSGRVMQKAGMTRAGVFRRADVCNHGVGDMVVYEMLPDDARP